MNFEIFVEMGVGDVRVNQLIRDGQLITSHPKQNWLEAILFLIGLAILQKREGLSTERRRRKNLFVLCRCVVKVVNQ